MYTGRKALEDHITKSHASTSPSCHFQVLGHDLVVSGVFPGKTEGIYMHNVFIPAVDSIFKSMVLLWYVLKGTYWWY